MDIDNRKKRKVLLLHHCDSLGGAGVSLLNTYNMLKETYDLKIYIPHLLSHLGEYCKHQGVKINEINNDFGMVSSYSGGPKVVSRTFLRNLLKIIESKKAVQRIIDIEKPDIIAVNSMTLAWTGSIIRKNSIKSICFVRETYVKNIGMKYIQYSLNKWFDGVIFISEYDKKKFNIKAPLVETVKNCVNVNEFSTHVSREEACELLGIRSNTFNVLFVGGTSELKGWQVISKAIDILADCNIDLIVAGNIDKKKIFENDHIKYIGEQSNMPLAYRACDVLVFPSTSPHQARPVFEAGFMGLPVIISDFDETREQVENEKNGLTFVPLDSSDLADKILMLYNNRELCARLGSANEEYSKKNHGYENCKGKLIDIINKI